MKFVAFVIISFASFLALSACDSEEVIVNETRDVEIVKTI